MQYKLNLMYRHVFCFLTLLYGAFVLGIPLIEASPATVTDIEAAPNILRWGADTQSNVPYTFYDKQNIYRLTGFETELVEALARVMGREPVFVQNDWCSLVPGLQRGSYDIALGGLTHSSHVENVAFSKIYLASYEQIVVRKDNDAIRSIADCQGYIIGTLAFSEAQAILERIPRVQLRPYAAAVNAFEDLASGRLDAVFLDAPICLYYGMAKPELKFVGDPIGRIEYCVAVSTKDPALIDAVNAALDQLASTGELRDILERWKLWNPYMADLLKDYEISMVRPSAYEAFLETQQKELSFRERFDLYIDFLPLLVEAAWVTMKISVIAMFLAITLGFVIALFRAYGPAPLRMMGAAFVEVIRGTPLLIQLYIIYYGLPRIGIWLDPTTAGVLGLGLNYAAYEAENYRAGLASVPHDQVEAASALAMSRWQSLRYVVLPQAFRLVLPPITNDFISLIKDSSLVSMITIIDLTQRYNLLATTYYDYFGIGILVGGVYLLLGVPFVRLAKVVERRFARYTTTLGN